MEALNNALAESLQPKLCVALSSFASYTVRPGRKYHSDLEISKAWPQEQIQARSLVSARLDLDLQLREELEEMMAMLETFPPLVKSQAKPLLQDPRQG